MNWWRNLKARSRIEYHVNVFNNETFAQRADFNIRLGRIWFLLGASAFGTMLLTTVLIAFTPVREAIPGYMDSDIVGRHDQLISQMDSLHKRMAQQDSFIKSIQRVGTLAADDSVIMQQARNVISGGGPETASAGHVVPETEPASAPAPVPSAPAPAPEPQAEAAKAPMAVFLKPVSGSIIRAYDGGAGHNGLDIAAPADAMVRAVAGGTVIFADYTLETGYVIAIRHSNNFISFYKHNSRLLKRVGSFAQPGEAIAVVGNSGEQTSGPHLHFELWFNGNPVDPRLYIPMQN